MYGVSEGDQGQRSGRRCPATEPLVAMGKYNEELINAGIMLGGDGLKPSKQGKRIAFDGLRPYGHRRPLRRDPRAGRRLLDLGGQGPRRGDRLGEALPQLDARPERARDPPGHNDGGLRGGNDRRRALRSMSATAAVYKAAGQAEPPLADGVPALLPNSRRQGLAWRGMTAQARRSGRSRRSSGSSGPGYRRPGPVGARRRPGRGTGAGGAADRPGRMAEIAASPTIPGAWLTAAAKRSAIDGMRQQADARAQARRDRAATSTTSAIPRSRISKPPWTTISATSCWSLIFTACHPVLSADARAALTLRLIGGLTTEEIARAFVSSEATIAQRIVRAKRRAIGKAGLAFEVPRGAERTHAARLGARGHLPDLQRRLCRHRRRGPNPARAMRRGPAAGPHPRRPDAGRSPRCSACSR